MDAGGAAVLMTTAIGALGGFLSTGDGMGAAVGAIIGAVFGVIIARIAGIAGSSL